MFRRVVLIIAALGALTTLFGVTAAQAQETTTTQRTCTTNDVYGCGTPGFILNPPNVVVGGQVTINGQGCDANQEVIFTINGQEVARTISDAQGNFSVTFTLPTNLGPGSYTIIGTCGNTTMSNVITITAGGNEGGGGNQPGGGQTPQTGSNLTMGLVRAGAVLIVVGGLVLILAKRRSDSAEAATS